MNNKLFGVLTITAYNRVVRKIVVNCNGQNIYALVESLKQEDAPTLEALYDRALAVEFGCKDCLVVMDGNFTVQHKGSGPMLISYPKTFDFTYDNRRWDRGTANYVKELRLHL